jgi:hypothetical protein
MSPLQETITRAHDLDTVPTQPASPWDIRRQSGWPMIVANRPRTQLSTDWSSTALRSASSAAAEGDNIDAIAVGSSSDVASFVGLPRSLDVYLSARYFDRCTLQVTRPWWALGF